MALKMLSKSLVILENFIELFWIAFEIIIKNHVK